MEELRRGWTNLDLSLHRVGRSSFFLSGIFSAVCPLVHAWTGIERLEQERQAREKLRAVESRAGASCWTAGGLAVVACCFQRL